MVTIHDTVILQTLQYLHHTVRGNPLSATRRGYAFLDGFLLWNDSPLPSGANSQIPYITPAGNVRNVRQDL
jgi:hypothetical protein